MNHYKLLLALLAAALPFAAPADVYKCRLPDGRTEISNAPCTAGAKAVTVRPDESISDSQREQAERDVERMRGYVDRREAAQRAESADELERLRLQSGRHAQSASPGGSYGNADECLRDVAQMVLGAAQRAQLESECRQMTPRPATTVSSPYPAVVPFYVTPPIAVHPPRPPKKPEEPKEKPKEKPPQMSILPRR